jgi:hypothetical protein
MKRENTHLKKRISRCRLKIIVIISIVTLFAILLMMLMPAGESDIRKSVCFVNGRAELCLVNGQDTIILQSDTICQQGVWINKHWWWPSCDGRILTLGQKKGPTHHTHTSKSSDLALQISEMADSIEQLLITKDRERNEIEYYFRSHGVQDEGYNRISYYEGMQKKKADSLKSVYQMLKSIKLNPHSHLVRRYHLYVSWYDSDGRLSSMNCQPTLVDNDLSGAPIIIHTEHFVTPKGIYAVKKMPWKPIGSRQIVTATLSRENSVTPHHTLLTTGNMIDDSHHNLPDLFARDGSPVFTAYGQFVGITDKQTIKY